MKVKVGPITVSYKGEASFQEKDAAAQRVVIRASGKETRGSGNAAALVTAQLKDEGDATTVVDHHRPDDLRQGRAVRPRRARRRVDQPDRPVREEPRGRPARRVTGQAPSTSSTPRRRRAPAEGDSVDLLKVVAAPMARRFAPAAAAARRGPGGRLPAGPAQARAPCRGAGRGATGRVGRLLKREGRTVRLSPARHRVRGGADCSASSATTPRFWPAGRAWCRCSRCA